MKNKSHIKNKPPVNEIHIFEQAIRNWKLPAGSGCKDLAPVYAQDRKDLRKVLALFKAGKYKETCRAAWNLDTIVREKIPSSVVNRCEAYT